MSEAEDLGLKILKGQYTGLKDENRVWGYCPESIFAKTDSRRKGARLCFVVGAAWAWLALA